MTKDQIEQACKWINSTLLEIYMTNINDKIDVTTLQALTPQCLDKPIMTVASTTYADKLKQSTAAITITPTHQNQLAKNCQSHIKYSKTT